MIIHGSFPKGTDLILIDIELHGFVLKDLFGMWVLCTLGHRSNSLKHRWDKRILRDERKLIECLETC